MSDIASPCEGDEVVPLPTPAELLDALGRFADRRRARYMVMARGWLRQYRLNTARFGTDDAINQALLDLCRRIHLGSGRPIVTLDEFERRFPALLKQVIIDRSRFQHAARRRGGVKTVYLSTLEESDFDKIDERAARPEIIVSGEEELRGLLDFLRRRHRALRAVTVMRMKEYTNEEIARVLEVSTSSVERMVRRIRTLLESRSGNHR